MRDIHRISIFSIVILMLSQAFMVVLVSNTFERTHLSSLLTSYSVPQKDFNRRIEAGLRFGKDLEHLLGVEELMAEYAAQYTDLEGIFIYSDRDKLLHSLELSEQSRTLLADQSRRMISVPDPLMEVVETEENYLIILPLFGPQETWMGTTASSAMVGKTVFSFYKYEIRSGIHAFWKERTMMGLLIAVCASILMFFFLYRIRKSDITALRRHIFIRVLGVTILAQLSFSGINAIQFHKDHVHGVKQKVTAQLDLLKTDMERVLARGIGLDRISRVDEFLREVMDINPEVLSLSIRGFDGEIKAGAFKEDMKAVPPESRKTVETDLSISLPLKGAGEKVIGTLQADLDESSLRAMIWKLLLDSLTIALIASLFITEQIYFLISRISRRLTRSPEPSGPQENLDKLMLARFAAFIFLFSFALPISFIPLQMNELYAPLLGLPRNIVLGLPISLEMLCALITSLAAGYMADKKDWRIPFVAGISITALGMLFSALANTGIQFILARGVCGAGYGLAWMALQNFLFSHSTPSTRAQGNSHFVAGIFSGHICGTALGAILAERLGYSPVFVVGFFMALSSLIFFFLFMRGFIGSRQLEARIQKIKAGAIASYLLDRNVSSLILFCVIPFSICQVGLLFFATPLYLNQMGVSQSDIGRVLMIYGLSVVYLAPQLSKIVDRRENKKPFIVFGGLLGGLGLGLLFFYQGFPAIVVAIFLLGLASSIGSSAQTAFALKLKATTELGQGKAMAIQRAADKLGQMMGPLAVGVLMTLTGTAPALVLLGLGYIGVSILFLFAARETMAGHIKTSTTRA